MENEKHELWPVTVSTQSINAHHFYPPSLWPLVSSVVTQDSTAAYLKKLQQSDPELYRKVFKSFRETTKGQNSGGRGHKAPPLCLGVDILGNVAVPWMTEWSDGPLVHSCIGFGLYYGSQLSLISVYFWLSMIILLVLRFSLIDVDWCWWRVTIFVDVDWLIYYSTIVHSMVQCTYFWFVFQTLSIINLFWIIEL